MELRHSMHHLQSKDSEAWMGLIDAVYAVAMTLIAVEMPELISRLLNLPPGSLDGIMKAALIIYLFGAYLVTFMVLYELWSTHKCIIKVGGLNHQLQNFINGMILACTCLGAGDVILIIKVRSGTFLESINNDDLFRGGLQGFHAIVMKLANSHFLYWIFAFSIVGVMYLLMYFHFAIGEPRSSSPHAGQLKRSMLRKAWYFLFSMLVWIPLLWGGGCLIPPIYMIVIFLIFSFFEISILSKFRRISSHV